MNEVRRAEVVCVCVFALSLLSHFQNQKEGINESL